MKRQIERKGKGGERERDREKKRGNILAHIERQRQQGRDKIYENKEDYHNNHGFINWRFYKCNKFVAQSLDGSIFF